MAYQLDGALAAAFAARQARIGQPCCGSLATHERDTTRLPPREVLDGYNGQVPAERGGRFLPDPQCVASSLSLRKPERSRALLMGMPGCLLAYAALEDRLRTALNDQEATFPTHQGKRLDSPTARWGVPEFVGIHLLCQAGQWPIGLTRRADHQPVLRLLGQPAMGLYDGQYS